MSGGSWEYLYRKVEEMAEGLAASKNPMRRAFATHLKDVAEAMHDIEWVDSYDYGPGDETNSILRALGKDAPLLILKECVAELDEAIVRAQKTRAEITGEPTP